MSRFYETPIGSLVSVTTVTGVWDKSSALIAWAAGCAAKRFRQIIEDGGEDLIEAEKKAKREYRKVSREALDIGSEVHNLIEVHLKGQPVHLKNYGKRVQNGYNAYLKWEEVNNFELIASERRMYSEKGFAGTTDCICKLNGEKYVIDFKTSKGVYEPGYSMQLSAYRDMVNDGYREDIIDYQKQWVKSKDNIRNAGVLVLNKETGMPSWYPYNPELLDLSFGQFTDLLNAWRKNAQRKNITNYARRQK
jgi:hypothetical protein